MDRPTWTAADGAEIPDLSDAKLEYARINSNR